MVSEWLIAPDSMRLKVAVQIELVMSNVVCSRRCISNHQELFFNLHDCPRLANLASRISWKSARIV